MTTRAQLRGAVRNELNDTGGTPLWSDALLNEWTNQAIRAYSRELPEEASTTIAAVAGQTSYALPARFRQALRVEQPKDTLRVPSSPFRVPRSGLSELGTRNSEQRWTYRTFAGSLILDPAPTAAGADHDIKLEYLRSYAEPAADADVLATPAEDDDVLVQLACADALRWIGTDESKRARFERQRGASPLAQAALYDRQARQAIATKRDRLRTRTLEVI